jgi:hypothetical protein
MASGVFNPDAWCRIDTARLVSNLGGGTLQVADTTSA